MSSLCLNRRKAALSHRSRSRKNRNPRIDTLLLAKYGIIQPTALPEGITVMQPLRTLTPEDREDLYEFAQFLMAPERANDFDFLEVDTEVLRDEP
jgi:hypothetical protein